MKEIQLRKLLLGIFFFAPCFFVIKSGLEGVKGEEGVYTLPPENIDKLEPNVLVCIVGGRRPINKAGYKGAGEAAPGVLRAGWAKKD